MRRQLILVVGLSAALMLVGAAPMVGVHGQATGGGKPDPVRLINLKDLKLPPVPPGAVHGKPTKITSAAELAKAFPDKDAQDAIAKQVDFTKQYLLYFRWSGSGGDKLLPVVTLSSAGNTVHFQYKAGLTDDLRHHALLFAVINELKWTTTP